MKEITQIITCEITAVIDVSDDFNTSLPVSEDVYKQFARVIKRNLNCDDVVVTNMQHFVREE